MCRDIINNKVLKRLTRNVRKLDIEANVNITKNN